MAHIREQGQQVRGVHTHSRHDTLVSIVRLSCQPDMHVDEVCSADLAQAQTSPCGSTIMRVVLVDALYHCMMHYLQELKALDQAVQAAADARVMRSKDSSARSDALPRAVLPPTGALGSTDALSTQQLAQQSTLQTQPRQQQAHNDQQLHQHPQPQLQPVQQHHHQQRHQQHPQQQQQQQHAPELPPALAQEGSLPALDQRHKWRRIADWASKDSAEAVAGSQATQLLPVVSLADEAHSVESGLVEAMGMRRSLQVRLVC